jgi:Protein of unknown function (DUF1015)
MNCPKIALQVPKILLPTPGIDLAKWAVIACDQYTSQPEYWDQTRKLTAGSPTTLDLIFPEVYLEDEDGDERIAAINCAMREALDNATLQEQPKGFVLLDRQTSHVTSRKGLVVALDLEQYDYNVDSTSLIRATEGTILDRLPPRIKVREKACLELPHIMVLIDDPQQTVIEPLFDAELEKIYDFELMQNGGHLKGWRIDRPDLIAQVTDQLAALADPASFKARYQVDSEDVVLYAMGDGNHSFATAKAIWEQLKLAAPDPAAIMDHPARYALVELVNLHDPGLEFEAIHRVLFGTDPAAMFKQMEAFYTTKGCGFRFLPLADEQDVARELSQPAAADRHRIPLVSAAGFGVVEVRSPAFNLVVATLQEFLDGFLAATGARIDYIHGANVVTELGSKVGNVGFYLPAISKIELFRTIILDGALPRKTFSMGEADEKRFYLECRRIVA